MIAREVHEDMQYALWIDSFLSEVHSNIHLPIVDNVLNPVMTSMDQYHICDYVLFRLSSKLNRDAFCCLIICDYECLCGRT